MRYYLRALQEDEIQFNRDIASTQLFQPPSVTKKELDSITPTWSLAMDEQLVEMMTGICEETGQDIHEVNLNSSLPLEDLRKRFPLIAGVVLPLLQFRFTVLRLFNIKLREVLPLIDFSQAHLPWSLAQTLMKLKGLFFPSSKLPLWNGILQRTSGTRHRPHVTIDRPRALKAAERECE